MCGIFGIAGYGESESSFSSLELLKHRGPDTHGRWADKDVIFEHTRLSIIDLSQKAKQPFCMEKRYVLVYNGEIYNFMQLRKDLARAGLALNTHSDTEVLYYEFIRYGISCLDKLNGMFAFAFYDIQKKKIYLVRDRYGIKPLYYFFDGRHLVFSSEQKAIYALVRPRLNNRAIAEYFAYKYVSGQNTIVKDVYELEPGHLIEFDIAKKSLVYKRWYRFPDNAVNASDNLFLEVKDLIHSAVSLRTISDVPIGTQLSGGVDSAIITKIMADCSGEMVRTYSIGFPGSEYNEEDKAVMVSKRIGTKHTQIDYTMRDFLDDWEKAIYHNDEPINHPHSLPIMRLAKIAASDVKVLLSGEGADEVFYGYEQYLNLWDRDNYKSHKAFLEANMFNNMSTLEKMLQKNILLESAVYGERYKLLQDTRDRHYNEKFYEFNTHLVGLLKRIDKMSMANALEVRTPYLDYRVVKFGLSQRKSDLIDNLHRKKPILRLYKEFLGLEPPGGKKIGFRVPYDEWLVRDQFRTKICDYIVSLKDDPLFNIGYIDNLVERTRKKRFGEKEIREGWVLANYAIWKSAFHPSCD